MISRAAEANDKLSKLPAFMVGDAAEVAAEGYRACLRGEVIKVPGSLNLATHAGLARHAEVAAARPQRHGRAAQPVGALQRMKTP